MCDYALAQLLVAQPRQRVEGTTALEGSNALVILAFEKEPYLGARHSLAFEGGTQEGFRGLWRRCEV